MKSGKVAIIGRPNSGKSTLLNNLLQHKVSITSPKPQTTRYPIHAAYEDERGRIEFIDTPGIFAAVRDPVSAKINALPESVLKEGVDVIVYVVDHTRDRDMEENKIFGLARASDKPKILTINKTDIKKPSFEPHYRFMEEEFQAVVRVSGLFRKNLNLLLDAIFELLPQAPTGNESLDSGQLPGVMRATPLLNMDSKTFIAEIIREKAFLFLRKEVPYTLTTVVDEVVERKGNLTYIRARIVTGDSRYKPMIVGEKGRMIKEIGRAARKELQTATNRNIYLELTVEVNPHWYETML